MTDDTQTAKRPSRAMVWTGRVISTLIVLMMGVGGLVTLLLNPDSVRKGMVQQGYPGEYARIIVIVEVVCALLYAIPRTAVLGAILLTGYLGGAVATHVRAGEPWFFPIVMGAIVWLGLFLRDPRVRELAPLRKL